MGHQQQHGQLRMGNCLEAQLSSAAAWAAASAWAARAPLEEAGVHNGSD